MALDAKRMLTFFNEFTSATTNFLNMFATDCDEKFFLIERRLAKIESCIQLVEEKISSVPRLTTYTVDNKICDKIGNDGVGQDSLQINPSVLMTGNVEVDTKESLGKKSVAEENSTSNEPCFSNLIKISESLIFKKYFMMLKVGVVEAAVRQKMISEGLDCDLSNPNLMVPNDLEKSGSENNE